ncbi:MAG: M23 family metallopeptidase [Spirochaetales bacterium]|nr:M23 family metallopeptidase [Spirochaetales bacterium]
MKKTVLFLIIFTFLCGFLFSSDLVHILRKGETLYSLSRTYQIPVEDIMRANGISDPARLSIGMEIRIPTVYIVEKGDTFYSLAKKFGTTIDLLCEMNHTDPSRILKIGESILVPHNDSIQIVESLPEESQLDREPPAVVVSSRKPFFWPHEGPSQPLSGKLEGLQFDGKDGDTVHSVSYGKVVWLGPYRGYNKIVFIQTLDDYIYGYGGNDHILVKIGDPVEPGTELGRLGVNSLEGKARMFFFVYRNGVAVDPYTAPRE